MFDEGQEINGHGERRLLVSFGDRYCTGYHCLRGTVAWLALKGSKSGLAGWCFLLSVFFVFN